MKTSTITFTHGETTCASKPGEFCRFLGAKSFGTKYVCMLFENTRLYDDHPHGWIQRCEQCLKLDEVVK